MLTVDCVRGGWGADALVNGTYSQIIIKWFLKEKVDLFSYTETHDSVFWIEYSVDGFGWVQKRITLRPNGSNISNEHFKFERILFRIEIFKYLYVIFMELKLIIIKPNKREIWSEKRVIIIIISCHLPQCYKIFW